MKYGGMINMGMLINLSEVICYRCGKPLGTDRTLMFDADGDKRVSTKRKWRHGECRDEMPDLRPDGE